MFDATLRNHKVPLLLVSGRSVNQDLVGQLFIETFNFLPLKVLSIFTINMLLHIFKKFLRIPEHRFQKTKLSTSPFNRYQVGSGKPDS